LNADGGFAPDRHDVAVTQHSRTAFNLIAVHESAVRRILVRYEQLSVINKEGSILSRQTGILKSYIRDRCTADRYLAVHDNVMLFVTGFDLECRLHAKSMVVIIRQFLQFADVDMFGKLLKMEHRIVLAVVAKECYVFAEIHVFQMVSDEAAVASLHPFAELLQNYFIHIRL
jgi:hypothetical protein